MDVAISFIRYVVFLLIRECSLFELFTFSYVASEVNFASGVLS